MVLLEEGDEVEFEIKDWTGHPRALNVTILETVKATKP